MSVFITSVANRWLTRILKTVPDMVLTMPGLPPSGNNYKGRNGNHWFLRPAAVKFKGLAAKTFYEQYHGWALVDTPVAIYVTFYVGPKTQIDLDNHEKILQDSFNGLVWADDRQIEFNMAEKIIVVPERKQKVADILETVLRVYC